MALSFYNRNMGIVSEKAKGILPNWIIVWFIATALICTWDASFIILRPHSLPGGSLHWIWYLYKYYIVVDQRYMDVEDAFVFAQSLLNYVEVVLNIVTLTMHFNRSKHTITTAFMVSVMTFWKTVLYFLMFSEFCTGGFYRQGNSSTQEFFLVFIPNFVWVVLPFAVMADLWGKLTAQNNLALQNNNQISNGFHDSRHVHYNNNNNNNNKRD